MTSHQREQIASAYKLSRYSKQRGTDEESRQPGNIYAGAENADQDYQELEEKQAGISQAEKLCRR